MKRILILTTVLIIGGLVALQSCKKEEIKRTSKTNEEIQSVKTNSIDYKLDDYEIRAFALNYAKEHFDELKNIEIEKVVKLKSDVKSKIIYAVIFNPDAYILLSDDKRDKPIYGYSQKADFVGEVFEELHPALNGWLHNLVVQNLMIESNKFLQDKYHTTMEWNVFIAMSDLSKITPDSCQDRYLERAIETLVPEMLTTRWGQDPPYNLQTPASSNCEHTATGCVATAMAQIIKNVGTPSYLSYGSYYVTNTASLHDEYLPTDTSPNAYQVANFMRIIGENVNMEYGCRASSANSSYYAKNYFRDLYDDNDDIDYVDYYQSTLIQNLRAGNPTYMRGENSKGDGHAWVADGYLNVYDKYYRVCQVGSSQTISGTIGKNFHSYCHMNWGWIGRDNGWFDAGLDRMGDFTPDRTNYHNSFIYDNKMIINIHP